MKVVYRGPGTGLRLEVEGNPHVAFDVGGARSRNAPMSITICNGPDPESETKSLGASILLQPSEVVLLIEECAHYLARTFGQEDR